MKRGRLIFSMVLCIVYIYLVGWAGGVVGGIAPLATGPHRLFMILGLIFNVVAIGVGYGWPCTTALIMYIIATVLGIYLNWMLVFPIVCMICCGTAISKTPEQLALEGEAQKVYVVNQPGDNEPDSDDKPVKDNGGTPILYNAYGIFVMVVGAQLDSIDDVDNEYNLRLHISARNNNSEAYTIESGYAYVDGFGRVRTDTKFDVDSKSVCDGEIVVRVRGNRVDGGDGICSIAIEVNTYPVSGGYADNFANCEISGDALHRLVSEWEAGQNDSQS